MKSILFLAACLSCSVAWAAQTAPSPATSTASPAAASGTKNVGSDRADAPQAPGMSTPTGQATSSKATRKTTSLRKKIKS